MNMIEIDGSLGEGGGQILRTSLALSILTGTAVRFVNIRANRTPPGLRRQHLTAVLAAARVGMAEVIGAEVGARELTFRPKGIAPGVYTFDVGTAGSTTLVLQTVLPALLHAHAPSQLTLRGGTHNMMAPPFEFLARSFVPVLRTLGADVQLRLVRPGFYPVGGGEMTVSVGGSTNLKPLELLARGPWKSQRARALLSKLPRHIAEREVKVIGSRLRWPKNTLEVTEMEAYGPGNAVVIEVAYENITEVFTGFGEKGKPAEQVARDSVDEAEAYLAHEAPVGPHLADQLLLPMALAGRGCFLTCKPTLHTETNIAVIRRFLDVPMATEEDEDGAWLVRVGG